MSKASRLEPLVDYADLREAEAAKLLAASAEALKKKEAEVEQLRSYLAEYRQRTELTPPSGADSLLWRNARAFLAKLSDAVAFQEGELKKAVDRYRVEADRWRGEHQRAQTLDKVFERATRDELHAAQKRDQAELDELAVHHHLKRDH